MRPFEVEHIREFGDGTCELRAILKPGFTTGDLIDNVLTRKEDVGYIYRTGNNHPAERVEYSRGKLMNAFIIPNKPIKSLEIYGGYHRWDYIYEV